MPSFVFSISSLPRSFSGLLFGVLKIFNANDSPALVVPEYSTPLPTKTTPIYLPPTRCIPGPSSSPSEFPDTALLGLIATVIIGFVCIVCTRFDASPPETRPPPPPKPKKLRPTSSSSTRDPWSQVIWAYLAIIVFGTPIAHHLYFDKPRLIGDLGTRIMLIVENAFLGASYSIESLFSLHIVPQWRQYCKVGFLAFSGHSIGFLVFFTYRRWYRLFADILQTPWVPFFFAPHIVPFALFASTRKLSWMLWFTYYTVDHELPTPQAMHDRLLRLPAKLYLLVGAPDSVNIWIMLGPFILNIITLTLLTIVLIARAVPWALRTIHRERDFTRKVIICDMVLATIAVCLWGGLLSFRYCYEDYRTGLPNPALSSGGHSITQTPELSCCTSFDSYGRGICAGRRKGFRNYQRTDGSCFMNYGKQSGSVWGHGGRCILFINWSLVVPIVMLYGHYYVMPEIRRQWYGWRFRRRPR
ncbi:hypothetical protein FB45DRAFT_168313 [Roridomyces roridus]|uniref:Uncharacterized protein n=1 Tax=Roridomyces roridus TaxID=1738132 RepID=A0AAD7BE78_9AGAR|nr:hypothetical protein FB45DRAFT_168313 [Roridomyces roridus]